MIRKLAYQISLFLLLISGLLSTLTLGLLPFEREITGIAFLCVFFIGLFSSHSLTAVLCFLAIIISLIYALFGIEAPNINIGISERLVIFY